jgi:YD repeat-containing protein
MAKGLITRYEDYDVFGNARRVIDPNGVATESTYDVLGRLLTSTVNAVSGCDTASDPLCATDITTSRTYSAGGGPLASETRPLGGVTSYSYDDRGRVASLTRTVSATLSDRMEYDYDPASGHRPARSPAPAPTATTRPGTCSPPPPPTVAPPPAPTTSWGGSPRPTPTPATTGTRSRRQ